jgi:hypothetical protein
LLAALQAKQDDKFEEAEDWMQKYRKLQGTGVTYATAPVGAMTYSAANLSS